MKKNKRKVTFTEIVTRGHLSTVQRKAKEFISENDDHMTERLSILQQHGHGVQEQASVVGGDTI